MKDEKQARKQREKTSASEWMECYKHEARAALVLFHGIDNPTEKQICFYILYGKLPRNP